MDDNHVAAEQWVVSCVSICLWFIGVCTVCVCERERKKERYWEKSFFLKEREMAGWREKGEKKRYCVWKGKKYGEIERFKWAEALY